MAEVTIIRFASGNSGEYHATVAGSEHTGLLTWVQRGNVRIAEHTLVPSQIGGRGVAGKLVAALIEDARAQGFTIDPQCSYVAAAFAKHPEWTELRAIY